MNGILLNNHAKEKVEFFVNDFSIINVFFGKENDYNYEIIEPIKENIYSSVYKAKYHDNIFIAIKKINKDKIIIFDHT